MDQMTHGMNIAEVRAVAGGLNAQATALALACVALDRLVGEATAAWSGPSALLFAEKWRGGTRGSLRNLAARLEYLAKAAASNADAQERVSDSLEGGAAQAAGRGAEAVSAYGHAGGPANVVHHVMDLMLLARAAYTDGEGSQPWESPDAKRSGAAADRDLPNVPYSDEYGYVPAGWRKLNRLELAKLGLTSGDLHDEESGFDATVFRRDDGSIVLAFRGTDELFNWGSAPAVFGMQNANPDVHNNTRALLDWTRQDQLSADLALKVRSGLIANGEDPGIVSTTGHSLGARNAMIAGLVTGSDVVAVDGLNVSRKAYERAITMRSSDAGDGKILMIADHNDSVSVLTPNGLPADAYRRITTSHSKRSPWIGDFLSQQEDGHVFGSAYEGYRDAIIRSGGEDLVLEAESARFAAEQLRRSTALPKF